MRARAVGIGLGGMVLALQLGVGPALAAEPTAAAGSLKPLAENAWDHARARHLLFRAGFGGTPEEVEKLHALGLQKAVASLVDFQSVPDMDLALKLDPLDPIDFRALAKLTAEERMKLQQKRRQQEVRQLGQLKDWWIKRMVESPRPLEEKLVLFWHGHFATEFRTVRNGQALADQNQLFREHAAGNFGKLLHGIVHDPAMLRYLDNDRNVRGRPNENLAREIMELFAMGEGQGYTEQDIKEGARALTGYTFMRPAGKFQFVARVHDPDKKTIFGKTGNWNGDQFVDLILEQPATPRFIARKLFTYFVHEEPDTSTIEQLAKVLKDNNYELVPLLKTMFLSEEFYSSRSLGMQIKSPAQLVIGTARTLGLRQNEPTAMAFAMRSMGQDLFDPPNVKGWDIGKAWINTNSLFTRENYAAMIVGQGGQPFRPGFKPLPRPAGRTIDLVTRLQEKKIQTPAAIVDHLARTLFAVPLTDTKRAELIDFLGQLPEAGAWADRRQEINARLGALLVLMMSMPEYQLT